MSLLSSNIPKPVTICAYLLMDLATGPSQRLSFVAASAAVVADMRCKSAGTVHSQLLPGAEQLNDRAEVFAILLALQLSKQ